MAGLLVAGVATAATSLSFTNTFTLEPGDYCLVQTNTLDGNKLKVVTTVNDGACEGDGETITIAAPEPVSVETPEQCSGITFNGVTKVSDTYGDIVVGTSKNDLLIANKGGSKVEGKGGRDCIVIVDNSVGEGNGGNDVILHSGFGGAAKGGTGTDYCEVGAGSSKQSCELPV